MSDEASARARRRAIVALVVVTAAGAGLIVAGPRYAPVLSRSQAPLVRAALGVLGVVPLFAFAGYLWRLGARALRAGRFPPPGTAMIRGATALVGDPARRRARLAQGFAVLLGVAAVALASLVWRLSRLLPAP